MITKEKIPWSVIKFSQLIHKGNVWRSVGRICMLILGLKGLKVERPHVRLAFVTQKRGCLSSLLSFGSQIWLSVILFICCYAKHDVFLIPFFLFVSVYGLHDQCKHGSGSHWFPTRSSHQQSVCFSKYCKQCAVGHTVQLKLHNTDASVPISDS